VRFSELPAVAGCNSGWNWARVKDALTSAGIAPIYREHTLAQPFNSGALRLDLPPAVIRMDLSGNLVALPPTHPRPLSMETCGASRYRFIRIHGLSFLRSLIRYKTKGI